MTVLPLTLDAHPCETPLDFASRLACRNRSGSLRNFAIDLGLSVRGLTIGEKGDIARLKMIAGLGEDAFLKTTPSGVGIKAIRFGKEFYRGHIFSRGSTRFCPQCVVEDMRDPGAYWQAVHRLHWQIKVINRCAEHGCKLIEVQRAKDRSMVIEKFLGSAASGQSHESGPVGDFERYLSLRAYGRQPSSWADNLEIFALWKAAMALGLLIERGSQEKVLPTDPRDAARMCDLAINIICDGPSALRACWDMVIRNSKSGYELIPHFGAFHTLMLPRKQGDFGFAPLRAVFRDYLVKNFPYAPGRVVLGEQLKKRHAHSVLSAQQEIGSRVTLFHTRLIEDGYAVATPSMPPRLLKPLTIEAFNVYVDELSGLIYERDAANLIGITVERFRLIAKADLVPTSRIRAKSKRRAFEKAELRAWIEELSGDAPALDAVSEGQAVISRAPVQLNCSIVELVDAMVRCALAPTGLLGGKLRLDHFILDLDLAKAALKRLEKPEGLKRIQTFRMLMFNNSTLNYLLERGLLEEFIAVDPSSRRKTAFISRQSIERFVKDYVALGFLAKADGAVAGQQCRKLQSLGMRPFIDQPNLSKIYRRTDLSPEYRTIGLDVLDELCD